MIPELDTQRLRNMAIMFATSQCKHECPREITKDLEQAAWEKFLKLKNYTYMWKDMEYAMLEEMSRWKYSCKRGRGKDRRLCIKLALKDTGLAGHTMPNPEQYALAKEIQLARGGINFFN